jgi:hypothetical protein
VQKIVARALIMLFMTVICLWSLSSMGAGGKTSIINAIREYEQVLSREEQMRSKSPRHKLSAIMTQTY